MTVKVVRSLATNNLLNKVMVPFVKVPWSGNVSSYHWELHQFQFDSIHSTSKTSSREATDGLTQKKAWFKSVNESTLRSKSTSSMIKMSRNYHEATGHFVVTAVHVADSALWLAQEGGVTRVGTRKCKHSGKYPFKIFQAMNAFLLGSTLLDCFSIEWHRQNFALSTSLPLQ